MGYRGRPYTLGFDKGGLTYNKNIDLIAAESMVNGSKNINLVKMGREKRGGTAWYYSTAISGAVQLYGIHEFRLFDGTLYIVAVGSDGKIYNTRNSVIKSGWTTSEQYADFAELNDVLYIVNGHNVPEKWAGSGNTATLTNIPSDWVTGSVPKWIVKHGRGASERLWAGGCDNAPNRVYASANGTDDFSDANVISIDIDTEDGFGIVGAEEYGDRLLCFGKDKVYVIDDLDSDSINWGYDAAQWEGGASNFRLIEKTPNDVISMSENGQIYSVKALNNYGDYVAASLSKPAFIDEWIQEKLDMSKINQFHMAYDPTLRALKIFVVTLNKTEVDTALVYFIDRPPQEAWMIHDNTSYSSGYNASCSTMVRPSAGVQEVFTGDYSGMVWKLEQTARNDHGRGFYAGFKTPRLNFGNLRVTKKYKRGWAVVEGNGNYDLKVRYWIDGNYIEEQTISLTNFGGVLGAFILGSDVLGGDLYEEVSFNIGNRGKRIEFEFYNSEADQNFLISQLVVDHTFLGARPS